MNLEAQILGNWKADNVHKLRSGDMVFELYEVSTKLYGQWYQERRSHSLLTEGAKEKEVLSEVHRICGVATVDGGALGSEGNLGTKTKIPKSYDGHPNILISFGGSGVLFLGPRVI